MIDQPILNVRQAAQITGKSERTMQRNFQKWQTSDPEQMEYRKTQSGPSECCVRTPFLLKEEPVLLSMEQIDLLTNCTHSNMASEHLGDNLSKKIKELETELAERDKLLEEAHQEILDREDAYERDFELLRSSSSYHSQIPPGTPEEKSETNKGLNWLALALGIIALFSLPLLAWWIWGRNNG